MPAVGGQSVPSRIQGLRSSLSKYIVSEKSVFENDIGRTKTALCTVANMNWYSGRVSAQTTLRLDLIRLGD